MKRPLSILLSLVLVAVLFLLVPQRSYAIALSIQPVKVYLDSSSGTGKVYLQNSSSEPFDLQIRVYAWSQDAEGKDVYDETSELVVFPKIFKIAAGEERMVRIGTKKKPGAIERCYRIYLQEIPVTDRRTAQGPSVRMLTRVGMPVFLAPLNPREVGRIEALRLEKGRLTISLKNEGNVHWPISNIVVSGHTSLPGKKGFSKEVSGWYLLSGASRSYAIDIPHDACASLTRISVEVNSEKKSLKGGLDVDTAMCSP